MRKQHRRGIHRALVLSIAASVAAPSVALATDTFDALVEASATKVLEGALLAGLDVPFERARVGNGDAKDVWWIRVDGSLPSPFRKPACAWPTPNETVCHVDGRATVCSREALAAIVGTAYDHSPKVCGGSLAPGQLPETNSDKSPIGLQFVLAHELAHIALRHDVAAQHVLPPVRGTSAQRKTALRNAVSAGRPQAKSEREADAWATKVIEALLARLIQKNGSEHAAYISTVFATDLRLTFLCVDEATRCRWTDAVQVPPSDEFLEREGRRLACRALTAKDGARYPVFRGTHGDWGMRLAAIQTMTKRWRKRYPPKQGTPFGDLASFIGAVDDVFVFWGEGSDDFYRKLGTAVRRATQDLTAKECRAKK